MLKKILIIVGLAVLTTACSNSPRQAQTVLLLKVMMPSSGIDCRFRWEKGGVYPKLRTNRPKSGLIGDKALAQVYNEWVGTRYRMGGYFKTWY